MSEVPRSPYKTDATAFEWSGVEDVWWWNPTADGPIELSTSNGRVVGTGKTLGEAIADARVRGGKGR